MHNRHVPWCHWLWIRSCGSSVYLLVAETRSRLLKILLKLEEIVGVIRGVNPEAILKGFIHSLKARLPEGDRKETEPERIRDDENRIEDSLEGMIVPSDNVVAQSTQ